MLTQEEVQNCLLRLLTTNSFSTHRLGQMLCLNDDEVGENIVTLNMTYEVECLEGRYRVMRKRRRLPS